ncbi:MAG TPA: hypothetical protein VG271_09645 [Beijerinckiaceae bacterium]|jgi:hypothetical protein|nr:hypothetical protein [Beijerinckiaceae bacterium]
MANTFSAWQNRLDKFGFFDMFHSANNCAGRSRAELDLCSDKRVHLVVSLEAEPIGFIWYGFQWTCHGLLSYRSGSILLAAMS